MEPDPALLQPVIDGVADAEDLESALNAIVGPLRSPLLLFHASIASHPVGAAEVTVLAAWSMSDSAFEAGTQVSATISPIVTAVLDTLGQGQMASVSVGADRDSLVDHLLREQGVAALLSIPLHRDDQALLLLTLGSSVDGIFDQSKGGFFSDLAAGIRSTVLRLATAPNT
ncbi:MAG: hypothetical protein ABR549_08555 [Mycobacteriales bacterium]